MIHSDTHMSEHTLQTAIRTFATERHYSPTAIERWMKLAPTDAVALLDLARELRLGEHQLGDLWDWAEEIAERDHVALARVLAADEIAAARQRAVGRNDKLKLIKSALRRQRFPELAAIEAQLAALLRELDLPRNVRVTLPEFLEGRELHIAIHADTAAGMHDAAEALARAAASPACAKIFALLTEAP